MTEALLALLGFLALLYAIHRYVLYDERRFEKHLQARREARWPRRPPWVDPHTQLMARMRAAHETHYFGFLTKPLEDEKP